MKRIEPNIPLPARGTNRGTRGAAGDTPGAARPPRRYAAEDTPGAARPPQRYAAEDTPGAARPPRRCASQENAPRVRYIKWAAGMRSSLENHG